MADKLDGGAIVANTIPGTKIQSGTITTTQLDPAIAAAVTVPLHPKISSLTYPGNDTAANTGGGDSIVINGSGFGTNVQVYINGTAAPSVTRNNANAVTITTAAQSAGTYLVYLINTDDGGTAILVPGIQYSGMPSWVTTSPLDQQQALSAWNISLSATGDSPITYALQAGSSLPAGITLAANGLISGTMTSPPESDTTYNFTVLATDPQFQDTPKAFSVSVTVIIDPQFQYTTLLLQADGTNNGNNHAFLDSSNNNFTITRNGNVSQGSFTPFSPTGWSNYFDGNGDYISASSNAAFTLGSSDNFTVECWVYLTAYPAGNYAAFASTWADVNSAYTNRWFVGLHENKVKWYASTGNIAIADSVNFPLNEWTHVAVVRNGSTITLYKNGISIGTQTSSLDYSTQGAIYSGFVPSGQYVTGYISNLRIVKGTAVYTSAFTPPIVPLTAISGTSFLTCQSNRLRDASTNNFAITRNGNVSAETFSPFGITTAYSPATHGGSAYFDGSDYLLVADNAALDMGTSDFTIEGWYYPRGDATVSTAIFSKRANSSTVGGVLLYFASKGMTPSLLVDIGGNWAINTQSSVSFIANQWNHFAVVRNGSAFNLYINGVSGVSATNAGAIPDNSAAFAVGAMGADGSGPVTFCYMSDFRVVKGTAVYTSAFTPPTAPLTNIANTSLLLNYTNAQIYDAAAGIVVETVGDAKVNTSIKKYGTGSIYFDGTGDWLASQIGPGESIKFGTGDFTIEGWFYNSASQQAASGIFSYLASTTYFVLHNNTGTHANKLSLFVDAYSPGTALIVGNTTLSQNVWYHFALTRASGVWRLFLNGNLDAATYTNTAEPVPTSSQFRLGLGNNSSNAGGYTGYMDDFRITKGLARYRYNFTPPTRAFSTKGGTPPAPTEDEYFDYTTLLLPGNGTNNQNNHTFLDSSNNNFTITRNGNATQGTFSPFSQTGWSNYFDGTGDYLALSSNAAFSFGTGDFTIEAWVYINAATTYGVVIGGPSGGTTWYLEYSSTRGFYLYDGGTALNGNANVITSQWVHLAVSRSGTSLRMFVNGLNTATYTNSQSVPQIAPAIGAYNDGTYPLNGYISNLRLVKGTALYTSNFTPSTTPLTAVANTVLLTCSTNRFRDESTNNFTLTRNGDTSVQPFSPFAPTASYAAANVGGSMYLDGTGDYLNFSNINLGTGDFTYEAWIYLNVSARRWPVVVYTSGGILHLFGLSDATGSSLNTISPIFAASTRPGSSNSWVTAANPLLINAWNHVAWVRSGTTITIYVNGVAQSLDTSNGSLTSRNETTNVTYIGQSAASEILTNSYLAGVRVSNSAVYTSNFTVASAPPTAAANTQLLLNFTNAGIRDATAKNVLETVGDAKISTVQSKFGGSSILINGTGNYLTDLAAQDYNFGTGDFTVETWIYINSVASYAGIVDTRSSGSTLANWTFGVDTSSGLKLDFIYGSTRLTGTSVLSTSTWHHVAVTRYDGTIRLFLNGIQNGTATFTSAINAGSTIVWIGGVRDPLYFNGYIQDLRITKGIARYVQNFTPPTSAFLTR